MNLATISATTIAAGFTALGVSKIAKTPFMRARAEHVGFSAERYQWIGTAEVAGAVGVVAGLRHPAVGYTAGAGLLVLLAGAAARHLAQGDGPKEVAPAVLFTVGTLTYLVTLTSRRPS